MLAMEVVKVNVFTIFDMILVLKLNQKNAEKTVRIFDTVNGTEFCFWFLGPL